MNFNQISFETSFGRPDQLAASAAPEIVFAGRSNVGKSSMINRVFGRKSIARVSSMPGKTATINFYSLAPLRIVDLPGYGYAKVSKTEKKRWSELIGGYFAQGRDIALVFSLIDMRHPPTKDDTRMVDFLIDGGFPFAVVLTKADKLGVQERARRMASIRDELPCGDQLTLIPFSSHTGEGVQQVRDILEDLAREADGEP